MLATSIPTIDIRDKHDTQSDTQSDTPNAVQNNSQTEPTPALSLDELSASLYKSLTHYPYYTVVNGFSPIKNPRKLELLLRAVREKISPQTGINKENFNSLAFTRVSVAHATPEGDAAGAEAVQISLTNAALPPHTDSAYEVIPHELVVFHCVKVDENGGSSFMIPVDDILQRLDDDVIARLQDPVYPFGEGRYPIICGDRNKAFIRYYNIQLQQEAIAESAEFTQAHLSALNALDNLLTQDELYQKFHLQPGQILFMNNQRVLHGRTALTEGTSRVLYRMRLSAASLSAHEQIVAPRDVQTHVKLAKELAWLGRFEQALHHYTQASELAPDREDILEAYDALLLKTAQL